MLQKLFQDRAEQYSFDPVIYFWIDFLTADGGDLAAVHLRVYGIRAFVNADNTYFVILAICSLSLRQRPRTPFCHVTTPICFLLMGKGLVSVASTACKTHMIAVPKKPSTIRPSIKVTILSKKNVSHGRAVDKVVFMGTVSVAGQQKRRRPGVTYRTLSAF